MARCGCVNECNCVVVGGDCVTVTGNGNPGTPYTISTKIDDDLDNQLSCVADAPGDAGGLYVPPPSVNVEDTNCIAMDGTGFPGDSISATPILDPVATNLMTCTVAGIKAVLTKGTNNCITLTGNGTVASPLVAAINFSEDAGNIAECRANGLYVPVAGVGEISSYAEMSTGGSTQIFGAGTGSTGGRIEFDTIETDVGIGLCDVANDQFLIPAGGAGWYAIHAQVADAASNADYSRGTANGFTVFLNIFVNGVDYYLNTHERYSSLGHVYDINRNLLLADGDEIEIRAFIYNDSAGAVSAWQIEPTDTRFTIVRIGD